MATTYVGEGDRFSSTAVASYTAGDIVVMAAGSTGSAGVAVETVATGGTLVTAMSGVWTVTKAAGGGLDFAVGERVFTTATGAVTPAATGNTPMGVAYAAAVTGATTAQVKLVNGGGLL